VHLGLANGYRKRDAGVVFVADDLAAWLVGLLADAGRRRLVSWAFGSAQERELKQAAATAVDRSVRELRPEGGVRAEELAAAIGRVFIPPVPEALLVGSPAMLEALQAGIAGQLARQDDVGGLTGTTDPSAELAALAETLSAYLVREVLIRGARGGPLEPLASQLRDDATHLGLHRVEEGLERLGRVVTEVLARLDAISAVQARPDVQGFDELLAEPMVGRAWLVAEIEAFCQENDRGYGSTPIITAAISCPLSSRVPAGIPWRACLIPGWSAAVPLSSHATARPDRPAHRSQARPGGRQAVREPAHRTPSTLRSTTRSASMNN
jgi:hypothetical protein